jgi:hypothetical protein
MKLEEVEKKLEEEKGVIGGVRVARAEFGI